MLVRCWPTVCDAGPASNQHWFNTSCLLGCGSGSAYCWQRVQADTDPMSVKCWASVTAAGQYPFSPSQYFMLAKLRSHSIHRPNAVKCWPASYTMARHRTNTRYTDTMPAIQTIGLPARCFEPKLGYCGPAICDAGPHSA